MIEKYLQEDGWTIECESPFDIRHEYTESSAHGNYAVHAIYHGLLDADKLERITNLVNAHNSAAIGGYDFIEGVKAIINEEYITGL